MRRRAEDCCGDDGVYGDDCDGAAAVAAGPVAGAGLACLNGNGHGDEVGDNEEEDDEDTDDMKMMMVRLPVMVVMARNTKSHQKSAAAMGLEADFHQEFEYSSQVAKGDIFVQL